jgi:hypothetical protein
MARRGGQKGVQTGVAVLTISRGTGPLKRAFWTGYWTGTGS